MRCYCRKLKEIFGPTAPGCSPCTRKARHAELKALGLTKVSGALHQAYRDCGMEPGRVAGDTDIWVPDWAAQLMQDFWGELALGAIMRRAIKDESFRVACVSISRLVGDRDLRRERMRSFALSAGVDLTERFEPA